MRRAVPLALRFIRPQQRNVYLRRVMADRRATVYTVMDGQSVGRPAGRPAGRCL